MVFERHKMKIEDIITVSSGTPQFRIKESTLSDAISYSFYGQQELENDLVGVEVTKEDAKKVSTSDQISLLMENDILFSLISGRTTIVRKKHQGYLYTQNYIKLVPNKDVDGKYLVYILNESDFIRKAWPE